MFNSIVNTLQLPIVYSVLALLSSGSATIFNDGLITFMQYLRYSIYNKTNQSAALASRGAAARQLVEREFSYDQMAQRYEAIYERLLAGGG